MHAPPPPFYEIQLVNAWVIRIILECILVIGFYLKNILVCIHISNISFVLFITLKSKISGKIKVMFLSFKNKIKKFLSLV